MKHLAFELRLNDHLRAEVGDHHLLAAGYIGYGDVEHSKS